MMHTRILLVDDDPFILKLLASQLAMQGLAPVDACTSGREALSFLEGPGSAGQLIFLDLSMPDMDGVEFVRQLVDRRYAGALVLVSGEDERILQTAERLARAHLLNVLGYLNKPVQSEALRILLDDWRAAVPKAATRVERIYTPGQVRRAIAGGELVNFYQPKVELASGAIKGVEALVRWRHPDDGLVSPDQFVDVAEQHGLIDELTQYVLGAALAQARLWRDAGLEWRVAVNISMSNLARLDFPDFVLSEITRHGLPATDIILEVTESRLMTNELIPLDILTRLRLKHISLSIDDFGTGHSSLAQLRNIPFDELKIDGGFVHGAAHNDTLRAIFTASLGMARQLGMQSVAEGVEDRTDWDFLHQQGCGLAQGYFIAKPMPAEELPRWLASWKARLPEVAPQ